MPLDGFPHWPTPHGVTQVPIQHHIVRERVFEVLTDDYTTTTTFKDAEGKLLGTLCRVSSCTILHCIHGRRCVDTVVSFCLLLAVAPLNYSNSPRRRALKPLPFRPAVAPLALPMLYRAVALLVPGVVTPAIAHLCCRTDTIRLLCSCMSSLRPSGSVAHSLRLWHSAAPPASYDTWQCTLALYRPLPPVDPYGPCAQKLSR